MRTCGFTEEQTTTQRTAAADDVKLDGYFQRYCDYTGGLGIGFVASHTYDFKFRQRLKATQDREIKRLFVLQHLYSELDLAISDFEKGIVVTGKNSSRKLTPEERVSTRTSIAERMDDLSRFDPGDPQKRDQEVQGSSESRQSITMKESLTSCRRKPADPQRITAPAITARWIVAG